MGYNNHMKLLLVDGSAVLHRAYHAYPPLTTRDGTIVGAVYGAASILINALNEVQPTHVVVAWDLPKPTFRHIKYVGYKAQRPKADEEMVKQIPMVKQVIAKMGLVQSEVEGYEADDIIGTLSTRPAEEVVILTGDQDTMQLVNHRVKVLTPPKGKEPGKMYGEQEVVAKYGVRPDQIVDYKALVGDPSDNIPGVAGIGPVTAAKLLNEYDTLEEIYKNLDNSEFRIQNSETLKIKLIANRESAFLSQELARIVTNIEMGLKDEEMEYHGLVREELKTELENLGFKSLLRRIWGDSEKEKITKKNDNQMGLF